MPTLFLTGATGYIGGTLADRLLASGWTVRGLVRSEASAARLETRGVQPVLGDLDSADVLTREAQAADGVIDTASADHAGSVATFLSALRGTGKPFIRTSGSSVVGDDARGTAGTGEVYDEYTPFKVAPLKQARRDSDLAVLSAADQGVRSIVICPSNIYGQGTGLNPQSVQIPFMVANAREKGVVQLVGPGLNVWSNVHIEDVVDLYLLALAKAPAGAFYFAENGEASFAALGTAIAQRLGLSGVESIAPDVAAARWGEARALFSLGSNSRVRAVRARRELGWSPRHGSVVDWILNEMPTD